MKEAIFSVKPEAGVKANSKYFEASKLPVRVALPASKAQLFARKLLELEEVVTPFLVRAETVTFPIAVPL